MATKPTERILDWASGGTNTDPGASKEAAGWVVSERPPAFWWNWILNSFGKWLSWSEDSVDELTPLTPVSIFTFSPVTAGGPPVVNQYRGVNPNGTHVQTSAGEGDTGGLLRISWPGGTFAVGPQKYVQISAESADDTGSAEVAPIIDSISTNDIGFKCYDLAGVIIDWDDITVEVEFHVVVWGTLA